MNNLKVLISEKELKSRVDEIANKITNDFKNEEIVLACILKGSMIFTADLLRKIRNNDVIIDFMYLNSYGSGTETSGKIDFKLDLTTDIKNKNVIIVEDIIDTGTTLYYLRDLLKKRKPKEIKLCTLLDKPSRRVKQIKVDYVGFEIENKFVVGYGMDYDEKYRNLPYIGYFE